MIIPPFGVVPDAAEIKVNYSVRIVKPADTGGGLCLEFRPRPTAGTSHAQPIEVMLGRNGMPSAVRIRSSDSEYDVYIFDHQEFDHFQPTAGAFAPRLARDKTSGK